MDHRHRVDDRLYGVRVRFAGAPPPEQLIPRLLALGFRWGGVGFRSSCVLPKAGCFARVISSSTRALEIGCALGHSTGGARVALSSPSETPLPEGSLRYGGSMHRHTIVSWATLFLGSSLLLACGSSSSSSPDATNSTGTGGASGSGTGATGGTSTGTGGTSTGTGGTSTGTGGAATGGTGTGGAATGGTGTGGTGTGGKAGSSTGKGGAAGTGTGGKGGGAAGKAGAAGAGGSMVGSACDPIAKTGCTAPQKCVAVGTNGMDTTVACGDPGAGPPVTQEGADCKRTSLGVADNCAAGLICTVRGVLDADAGNLHTQCRKFCSVNADCADNQLCEEFTTDGFGVCINACIPFTACLPASQSGMGSGGSGAGGAPANGTCSEQYGFNEDPTKGFFGCHQVGSSTVGGTCNSGYNSKDCGVNQFCAGDPANPQATMGTCTEWCRVADPSANPPIPALDCTKAGQACVGTSPGEINICM
jgi:hypothetical protein